MSLAEQIKHLRTRAGWTQKELGDRIGVSDKVISKWESGRSLPKAQWCVRLAECFGVSMEELFASPLPQSYVHPKQKLGRSPLFWGSIVAGFLLFAGGTIAYAITYALACSGGAKFAASAEQMQYGFIPIALSGVATILFAIGINKKYYITNVAWTGICPCATLNGWVRSPEIMRRLYRIMGGMSGLTYLLLQGLMMSSLVPYWMYVPMWAHFAVRLTAFLALFVAVYVVGILRMRGCLRSNTDDRD